MRPILTICKVSTSARFEKVSQVCRSVQLFDLMNNSFSTHNAKKDYAEYDDAAAASVVVFSVMRLQMKKIYLQYKTPDLLR